MACARLTALVCLLPLAAGAALAAGEASHFDCQVTGTESLPGLAFAGPVAELTRFTCRVRGGLLDGFRATGTNIWDGEQRHGVLLGSLAVARKDAAVVVYELTRVTREVAPPGAAAGHWEGRGTGIYRLATGAAAGLAGRTFHSVARSAGPGAFTIETVVGGD